MCDLGHLILYFLPDDNLGKAPRRKGLCCASAPRTPSKQGGKGGGIQAKWRLDGAEGQGEERGVGVGNLH